MTAFAGVINFGGSKYKPDPFPQNASPAYAGDFNYQAPNQLSSFSITPTSGHLLSTVSITATGISTTWTGSNPFSITGGSGTATLTGYTNISSVSATFNLNVTVQGTIIISDSSSGTTQTYTSAAIVPNPPTSLTATAGNTQASITFSAPVDNGGSAITGYTLTSIPGGGTDSNAGSTSLTHIVTGLTNGTSYTFTAVATNTVGTSSVSSPSNPVTPVATGFIISPTGGHTLGQNTITATGTNSNWTGSNPFSITTGGSFASLSNYSHSSTTAAAFTLTISSNNGAIVIHDSSTNTDQTYTAASVAPDAPTIGTLTNNGNGTMTVTFTPPADNGGATITSYTASGSSGGASNTGSASPITINIVNFGVSQTVHVTATNTAGTSSASAESNSITPAAGFTLSPTSTSSTGVKHLTATGFGTTWTGSNSFSITGGPANTLANYVRISGTSATFDITVTALTGGPVVINDTNSSSNTNFIVSAAVPPTLFWYQLDVGLYVPTYFIQLDTTVRQLCTANSVTAPVAQAVSTGTGTLLSDWNIQMDTAIRALCTLLSVIPPVVLLAGENTGQYEATYLKSRDVCVRALCAA